MKTLIFKSDGSSFSAISDAEAWLKDNGYSVGSMERGYPIGVMKGDVSISKWTRMTATEHEQLDGRLSSTSFRNDDVTLELKE